jgi:hypothetical protein
MDATVGAEKLKRTLQGDYASLKSTAAADVKKVRLGGGERAGKRAFEPANGIGADKSPASEPTRWRRRRRRRHLTGAR